MAEDILRKIHITKIVDAVANGLKDANQRLPEDIVQALEEAYKHEIVPLSKQALGYILKNLEIAENMSLPVCQDTGLVSVQAKIGQLVHIEGGSLEEGIQRGVRKAYSENSFRASVVNDPLFERKNTGDNTPAIVHVKFTEGDELILSCMPKGFGSENMSCLKMFPPSTTEDDIVKYVVDAVKQAGANPCPPILLGIGIGGSFDSVTGLAKEALMLPIGTHHPNEKYARLESKILDAVNKTGIGVQGFGGNTTALAVHIKDAPTHVAGMPVAICFSCYATRRVEIAI